MKKKVILLTGNELRHQYFRMFLSNQPNIEVIASYCESVKGNINAVVQADVNDNSLRTRHLQLREQTEKDFFESYCNSKEDLSNPKFIVKGEINDVQHVNDITALNPDLIISYGCSIIRSTLLDTFQGRFINIHLGLSPYYRGSGTNYWPFANRELQFVGTTFMYIDAGIDTGDIIHQIRADIQLDDNIHTIGNRLIKDSFTEVAHIITHFDDLNKMDAIDFDKTKEKVYRQKDFSEISLEDIYSNIENNMIAEYIAQKEQVDASYPIVTNSALK